MIEGCKGENKNYGKKLFREKSKNNNKRNSEREVKMIREVKIKSGNADS